MICWSSFPGTFKEKINRRAGFQQPFGKLQCHLFYVTTIEDLRERKVWLKEVAFQQTNIELMQKYDYYYNIMHSGPPPVEPQKDLGWNCAPSLLMTFEAVFDDTFLLAKTSSSSSSSPECMIWKKKKNFRLSSIPTTTWIHPYTLSKLSTLEAFFLSIDTSIIRWSTNCTTMPKTTHKKSIPLW